MTCWIVCIILLDSGFVFIQRFMSSILLICDFNVIGDVLFRKASPNSAKIEKVSFLPESSPTITYSTLKPNEGKYDYLKLANRTMIIGYSRVILNYIEI